MGLAFLTESSNHPLVFAPLLSRFALVRDYPSLIPGLSIWHPLFITSNAN